MHSRSTLGMRVTRPLTRRPSPARCCTCPRRIPPPRTGHSPGESRYLPLQSEEGIRLRNTYILFIHTQCACTHAADI